MVAPDLTLGPLLAGTLLNTLLYGVCVLQFITYATSGYHDTNLIKNAFPLFTGFVH